MVFLTKVANEAYIIVKYERTTVNRHYSNTIYFMIPTVLLYIVIIYNVIKSTTILFGTRGGE